MGPKSNGGSDRLASKVEIVLQPDQDIPMRNRLTTSLAILAVTAGGLGAAAVPAVAKHGADDPVGHVRGGHGADDAAGHIRGGHGADDAKRLARRGRGADDAAGHKRHGRGSDDAVRSRRGRGADDAPGHVRHSGNDDGAGHR